MGAEGPILLPPPVDPGPFALSLLWHARHQNAPRHVWLRRIIVASATEMKAEADLLRQVGAVRAPFRR